MINSAFGIFMKEPVQTEERVPKKVSGHLRSALFYCHSDQGGD